MLFATRQSAERAARLASPHPSTYFGQCEATHGGCRKFAEIGVQPRCAAATTPFENGATAVTTIGGCGRWSGLTIAPCPSSGRIVRAVENDQYVPVRS